MSEQQELLSAMSELDPVAFLLVLYLRQEKLEIDNIMREQEIRKRKIQQLNDMHYNSSHCACSTCGALPNKRMRKQPPTEEEYKRNPGCVYQSKL